MVAQGYSLARLVQGRSARGLQLGAVSPREVCSSRVEDGGVRTERVEDGGVRTERVEDGGVRTERVEDGGVAEDDVGCVGRWAVVMLVVSVLI